MKNLNLKQLTVMGTALCVGVGALCDSKQAAATPASLGFYPSTDIYSKGNVHVDVDTYGKALRTDASVTTGLTYGLGPDHDGLFGRSEIGFDTVLSLGGSAPGKLGISTGKRLLFNAKTQLFNNDDKGTRIIAGVWGLGDKSIFAPNIGYITGSKTFDFGRVHLGLAHSFAGKSTVATPAGNSDRTNLHLGYDRYFAHDKLQFAADFYSGKSGYSGIQPTLYFYINDKADFGIGYFRLNDKSVTPTRNQVYVFFDYNFGGPSSSPTPPLPDKTPEPASEN